MIIDDLNLEKKLFRKTYYDIYIMSEINYNGNNIQFYNKTYNGSVSIVSKCLSAENNYCKLKDLIDLSSNSKSNIRNLKEINDLKYIPIPICLFKITDNNYIISISCPES